jgi:sugar phosphate isomerase/epimerase
LRDRFSNAITRLGAFEVRDHERFGFAQTDEIGMRALGGCVVYVACSTLCFSQQPLDSALRQIRDMNFAKADLAIHEDGPHLRPSQMTGEIGKIAQKIKASNVSIAAIHTTFAALDGPEIRNQLRGVCRLARMLTVPLVSVQASPKEADLAQEITRLTDWVKIAEVEGTILTVETNSSTLTVDPKVAIELCQKVSGLGLTLDPSHYIANTQGPVEYETLYPYVKHVRLRDSAAKPDAFQVPIGMGALEYGRIITQLDRFRYNRALTVDVHDIPGSHYPVEPEVRKLKYLLESLV